MSSATSAAACPGYMVQEAHALGIGITVIEQNK